MNEDLKPYCAEGCSASVDYVKTAPDVSVRVYSFAPPEKTHKPPVVFVAGWISMIKGWQDVLQEMTREFPVYYIETREKISSRVTSRTRFSVETIGDDIVNIVRQLDLKNDQYLLFGSSLGGTVILDCFRKLRIRPHALILIGPNAEFYVPLYWKMIIRVFYPPFYLILRPAIKWYLKNIRMNVQYDYAQYEKYSRALDAADPFKLKKAVVSFWSYQVWDRLPGIDVPVLMVGASRDKLHEPENMKRMASMLDHVQEVDMGTNQGTHSREVVGEIKHFLKNMKK